MTNTLHGLDLGANYTLKRIAFINSSQAAYITFPIDKSATLSGNNNHGKSSTLRAIKFFLLPEVNLNDMERSLLSWANKDHTVAKPPLSTTFRRVGLSSFLRVKTPPGHTVRCCTRDVRCFLTTGYSCR